MKGFGLFPPRAWERLDVAEAGGHGVHAEKDFESFVVLTEDRLVTRLCETRGVLYRRTQKDGRSNHLPMIWVGSNLCGDCCGNSEVQGKPEDEVALKQNHLGREKRQGQSGTRAVATVPGDRNCGYLADADDLGHDLYLCLDHGLILDLCVSPRREDHALGQHSTGLSTPDSYGTQPFRLRQRHLVRTKKRGCVKGANPWKKPGPGDSDE